MVFHWVGKKILPNDRKKLFNVDLEFVQFFEIFIENLEKEKKIRELGNFRRIRRKSVDVSTYVYIIYRSNDVLLLNYTLFLSFFLQVALWTRTFSTSARIFRL